MNTKRPYTRHKRQDKFRLVLPPCKDFPGGTFVEYGFSHYHALTNGLRKRGYLHVADDYIIMLRKVYPEIDIQLETGGTYRTVKHAPELEELREFAIEKTGKTKTDVYNIKFSALYKIWDGIVNKPVTSVPEAVKEWIEKREKEREEKRRKDVQYELF